MQFIFILINSDMLLHQGAMYSFVNTMLCLRVTQWQVIVISILVYTD